MSKTFVTFGASEICLGDEKDILYAGQDEAKAFSTDQQYIVLGLEVWVEGVCIQKYLYNDNEWQLQFDKIELLKNELLTKETESQRIEEELAMLISALESKK